MYSQASMHPSSSSQVLCPYPPGYNTGNDHLIVTPQSYHQQNLYPLSQNDRWLAEREQVYHNRERNRQDRCPANFPHVQPRSSHQSSFSHAFTGSSAMVHPSFQPYARPAEVPQSVPSWDNWEMHADPNLSVPHVRRFDVESVAPQIPPMAPQQFNELIIPPDSTPSPSMYTPSEQTIPVDGFHFPHRLSPLPSPTPSPSQDDVKPNIVPFPTAMSHQTRRKPSDGSESGKTCSHCHATSTPLWRRDPSTMKPLCNACGLYLQQRNKLRPQELIDADDDGCSSDESDANYVGPECSHCHTHRTSVWRRSKSGDQLCNACGVYARLRGKPRPLSLRKNKIRPRSKHSAK